MLARTFDAITVNIKELFRARDDRIAALEAKLAVAEKSFGLRYAGVWRAEKSYSAGVFATHSGSLWHCNRDGADTQPGSSSDWTLAVKSGSSR